MTFPRPATPAAPAIRMLRAIALGLMLLAAPAWAGNTQVLSSKGGPVTIKADEMAFSGKSGKITFTGQVRVEQDGITLSADRIEVVLEGGLSGPDTGIRHMVAEGNVVFSQGERTATAGKAEYAPEAATVVLSMGPRVVDANMAVVGERITIDLNSGESTVEGGTFTFTEGGG